jgi:hypothetical protein
MTTWTCRRCGGELKPGTVLHNPLTAGLPDLPGTDEGVTLSPDLANPVLLGCLKCEKCGYSLIERLHP